MIVPVYQSEISPAENRGKLACIEFTGNIVGYASSVVRYVPLLSLSPLPLLTLPPTVDRLFRLLPPLGPILASTPLNPMYNRSHPRRRMFLYS